MASSSVSKFPRAAARKSTTTLAPSERERAEEIALAGHLMAQAVRAAIVMVEEMQAPQIASDVLRLARDRWATVYGRQS